MKAMFVTSDVFSREMDCREEHPANIEFMFVTEDALGIDTD
jgi:hypothetical protein